MTVVTDREELLRLEDRAWREFVAEVGRVPESKRSDEGVVPGWSTVDLVYHTGMWAGVAAHKLQEFIDGGSPKGDPDEVCGD